MVKHLLQILLNIKHKWELVANIVTLGQKGAVIMQF